MKMMAKRMGEVMETKNEKRMMKTLILMKTDIWLKEQYDGEIHNSELKVIR